MAGLSIEDIQSARRRAAASGSDALSVLVDRMGSDEAVATALGAHLGIASLPDAALWGDPCSNPPEIRGDERLPDAVLLDHGDGRRKYLVADPFTASFRAAQERCAAEGAQLLLVSRTTLHRLRNAEAAASAGEESGGSVVRPAAARAFQGDAAVVVESVVADALACGASDIHFENTRSGLAVKYRLDGMLSEAGSVAGDVIAEQVISRIKVMSGLDIAESRIPQDGRFGFDADGRTVDLRVSVMPGIAGEDCVLRILDKRYLARELDGLRIESLGFDRAIAAGIRRLAMQAYGMFLVTGPTGSGKSTTLYATLTETRTGEEKIITIEDPVEYELPGVLQVQVNEKRKLTFAVGLRSILRHDPDKILVGEIRDPETARIALQAAMTGHLVYTTVHANNALDVIARFTHMGIEPHILVSAINGILAQRLARRICRQCREPCAPDRELLGDSGLTAESCARFEFRIGRGCAHCRGTGYKGRRAIAELLPFTRELREALARGAPREELQALCAQTGYVPLRQAALAAVAAGDTTLREINRVTLAEQS